MPKMSTVIECFHTVHIIVQGKTNIQLGRMDKNDFHHSHTNMNPMTESTHYHRHRHDDDADADADEKKDDDYYDDEDNNVDDDAAISNASTAAPHKQENEIDGRSLCVVVVDRCN